MPLWIYLHYKKSANELTFSYINEKRPANCGTLFVYTSSIDYFDPNSTAFLTTL